MADYFGNKILMAQGDAVGLKQHVAYNIADDDFFYLKPGLMSRRTLNALHHYTSGRGIFIPTQMPKFMEFAFEKQTKFVRQMMLVAATRLEFATDISAEIGTKETGIEGQAMDYVSKTGGVPRKCSITFVAELDGGLFTFWSRCLIEGIMSTKDGVQHMYGFTGAPTPANYSMEGIYITMDPTEQFVVYSSYVQNMILENANYSIFNTTKGEFNHQEVTMNFGCQVIDNDKQVFEAAQGYLDKLNVARGHAVRLTGNEYPSLNIPQSGRSVI